ncbi:hypothetical protein [Campylobacter estrildidarum]|uniref:Periplasmic protein n=1 Tax=Campylobacter estrildidarum TaxID=2510189 RepID=A0A4U7BMV7_9BACT|nr:hypothetical protein [Campylobacter estrildidarum]TKX31971.1 hypothetical protein CQA69_00190 [Campylobacter estrildidarum]
MDKIEFFLENLNLREKVLIAIIVVLLAVFLAFKADHLFSNLFFNQDIFIDNINTEKEQLDNKNLEQKIQKLNQELQQIQNQILIYKQYLNSFRKENNQYLNNINLLASKNKINIKNITQTVNTQKNQLNKYELFLEAYGNFNELMSFIKVLENSDFYYQLNTIEIQNINTLNLELSLDISFLTL